MPADTVGGKEFLERYFRDCNGSKIELRALKIFKKGPAKCVHQKAYTEIPTLLSDAEKLDKTYNIYFNTAALNGGFTEEHAVACPAIRIDIDFKNGVSEAEARKILASFPLQPSAIVCTGGGLHVYWFLSDPAGREEFHLVKEIIKALAFTFRADLNACDIPRILRLPGTTNFKPKYNPPRLVTLAREDWHPEREFSLLDFSALLPIEGEVQQPSESKATSGTLLPLSLIRAAFERCEALARYKCNATETGRLLPEDDPREHAARIASANYCRAFDGGVEWAVEAIFRHLEDFDTEETRKQFASLTASPPLCAGAGLCPGGQCDAIKTLGKKSPIAFAYKAMKDAKTNRYQILLNRLIA